MIRRLLAGARRPRALLVRGLLVLLALVLPLGLTACGGEEEISEEDQSAIATLLESYLPVLATGYASGDLEPLREYAAEREVARAFTRVTELAESNRYVEPTFHQLTVEEVVVWGSANAYVTTVEVWDLRVFAYGSAQLLGQEIGQSSRVKYQLKKRGGQWQVLYRELAQVLQEGEREL
ncbi:MAG: IMS domain-containing protein [Acidobacteriota bacterium]